ncbi:hypothetical protein GOL82_25970 [Sinorhizobium medicae]|nr:hypothetical protein [Sinorhizobium medicae]MDX0420560.1 hypothetical protein [Sinorhizobium medicae]MDX1034654.1 hypothetical protein [Sinorhizobium medicae]
MIALRWWRYAYRFVGITNQAIIIWETCTTRDASAAEEDNPIVLKVLDELIWHKGTMGDE